MRCPHCKDEVLVAIENDRIEVDYCTECRGIWLDRDEIELMFGDAKSAGDFLSIGSPAEVPKGEKHRACPECDARMTKEATSSEPPVIFDHCPNGDGLWFDHHELNSVLTHADAFGEDNAVRTFLRDVFANSTE